MMTVIDTFLLNLKSCRHASWRCGTNSITKRMRTTGQTCETAKLQTTHTGCEILQCFSALAKVCTFSDAGLLNGTDRNSWWHMHRKICKDSEKQSDRHDVRKTGPSAKWHCFFNVAISSCNACLVLLAASDLACERRNDQNQERTYENMLQTSHIPSITQVCKHLSTVTVTYYIYCKCEFHHPHTASLSSLARNCSCWEAASASLNRIFWSNSAARVFRATKSAWRTIAAIAGHHMSRPVDIG